ncbi:hypothetical protein [Curtobacterium sp. Leaf261]|uniref:hypothetical protein n=1 Tax=Curtobacterium sp. Leaf261 TaxID=1736311 RepID=UPI000A541E6D|nr:hypothetical protein [Curtobacterium sp. Leaf261]
MDPNTDEPAAGLTDVESAPTPRLTEAEFLATPALLTGDAPDLIEALEAGATRRGLDVAVLPSDTDGGTAATGAISAIAVKPSSANLAVLAIRRRGSTSPLARAFDIAARLDPLLTPEAVVIVVTVKGVTELAPDKLERLLSREILHQVESAIAPSAKRPPWRRFRLRAGLAALDAAGVRVLRLQTRTA